MLLSWHEALANALYSGMNPLEKLEQLVMEDGRLQSPLAQETYGNDYQQMYIDITKYGRQLVAVKRRNKDALEESSEARAARGV